MTAVAVFRRLLFPLAALAVAVGSLLPPADLPPVQFWDKAMHAGAYALLTWLLLLGYRPRLAVTVIVVLGWGVLIELAQAASGYRTGDLLDVVANGTGIAVALLAWRFRTRP